MPLTSLEAQRLDAWLTREPDYGPDDIPQPKCNVCGRFVSCEVVHSFTVDDVAECSGSEITVEWSFGTQSAPLCEVDGWGGVCPREPHFYETPYGYVVLYRRCTAGHYAREMVA